jgi:hypothetical protein
MQLGGGNLTYIDKGADVKQFTADAVTPPAVNGTSASWGGTGTWIHSDGSSQSLSYQVTVADNGPGGKTDKFSIAFGSYSDSGTLGGGNITIH